MPIRGKPGLPQPRHTTTSEHPGDHGMPAKKQGPTAPPLRITLPGGSCVVGNQASLAKILELTLFRAGRTAAPARLPAAAPRCRRAA